MGDKPRKRRNGRQVGHKWKTSGRQVGYTWKTNGTQDDPSKKKTTSKHNWDTRMKNKWKTKLETSEKEVSEKEMEDKTVDKWKAPSRRKLGDKRETIDKQEGDK